MNSYVSVGYLQPGPSRITPGDLQVVSSGRKADCGRMPDWHYLSDVNLEWPLSVDLSGVKQDCDLADDAEFGVVLSWRSDRTNLRGSIPVALVSDGENLLRAVISGATVGGTLTVEVVIVLRKPGTAASPLAPYRQGTLLWSRAEQVVLEGAGGRFPMISADFAAEGLAGEAAGMWYLDNSDDDLEANCTTVLALYTNSGHPDIQDLQSEGGTARNPGLVKFMMYDVYRQLMRMAIRNEEFDDLMTYGRGSLGSLLVTLLRIFFPGKSVAQLRRDFEFAPSEVEAELLALVWKLIN